MLHIPWSISFCSVGKEDELWSEVPVPEVQGLQVSETTGPLRVYHQRKRPQKLVDEHEEEVGSSVV